MDVYAVGHSQAGSAARERRWTHLAAFNPAATIFWKMSSQRSGTGKRNVWNSPELCAFVSCEESQRKHERRTIETCADRGGRVYSCPIARHRLDRWICEGAHLLEHYRVPRRGRKTTRTAPSSTAAAVWAAWRGYRRCRRQASLISVPPLCHQRGREGSSASASQREGKEVC